MSFDKIEFVKPNDILQGGFNPNLPTEISVTEQLLYSIANNLAILNNNLINSGALQNLALLGDLMQEVFTDDRVTDKKTSVLKTSSLAVRRKDTSVFVGDIDRRVTGDTLLEDSITELLQICNLNDLDLWYSKNTGAIVNQAASTYSFNVPVPSVSVSSAPATVNVSSSAPVVNNNIPAPHVTNNIEVAPAVPEITVNATAPVVNNNIPVPSVTNEIEVQSAVPDIEVSSTAPVVNVSSSPATVNVSSTAPIVNNNIPVPSVSVSSAPATVNVASTAPTVNVTPKTEITDAHFNYDDAALIAKIEEIRELFEETLIIDNGTDDKKSLTEVLENALLFEVEEDIKIGLTELLEDALLTEVDTDLKKGLTDIILERDNVNLIDYPVEMLTEPATTKKLREF